MRALGGHKGLLRLAPALAPALRLFGSGCHATGCNLSATGQALGHPANASCRLHRTLAVGDDLLTVLTRLLRCRTGLLKGLCSRGDLSCTGRSGVLRGGKFPAGSDGTCHRQCLAGSGEVLLHLCGPLGRTGLALQRPGTRRNLGRQVAGACEVLVYVLQPQLGAVPASLGQAGASGLVENAAKRRGLALTDGIHLPLPDDGQRLGPRPRDDSASSTSTRRQLPLFMR